MPPPLNDTDEDRFQTILRETHLAVRSYVAGLGVPSASVDELATQSYLELYRNFQRMPADASPKFWVKGIAKNLVRELFAESLHRRALAESLGESAATLQRSIGSQELDSALAGCIEKLPDDRRTVLESRYKSDQSATRIGSTIGQPAGTVREMLYRIRGGLKDCVTRGLDRVS